MALSTNQKIAIAVGATVAVALVGASAFAKPAAKLPAAPPSPPMFDAYAVLDKAAQYETDIGLLKDIRDRVLAASIADKRWDPYFNKIQARLEVLSPIERVSSVASAGGSAALTWRQAMAK